MAYAGSPGAIRMRTKTAVVIRKTVRTPWPSRSSQYRRISSGARDCRKVVEVGRQELDPLHVVADRQGVVLHEAPHRWTRGPDVLLGLGEDGVASRLVRLGRSLGQLVGDLRKD